MHHGDSSSGDSGDAPVAVGGETTDHSQDQDEELEIPTARRNLSFNLFAPVPAVEQITETPDIAADDIIEDYINYKVNYNNYLLDGAKKFSAAEVQSLDLVSLIKRFDSMKFLCAHGKTFPSICLLARSLMGKYSNNGFQ